MAEIFKVGINRLVYQSSDFTEGLIVKASIYGPTAIDWISGNQLTEINQGIYYLDYNFTIAGTYIVKFAENGDAMTTSTYRVWDIDTDVDNVYNNSRYISSQITNVSSNVAFVKDVEGGRWVRSGTSLYLYKSDNTTLLATFALKDISGNAVGASDNVYERYRIA